MQVLFGLIVDVVFAGTGSLIKKLFGKRPSDSGNSEMWIGASVIVAAIVIVFAVVR
jgi:hypothetical protein